MVATFFVGRTLGGSATLFDGAIPSWTYLAGLQNFWMTARETYGAVWLGGTWSLAIEEQFYLVFPLIVRFSSRLTLRRLLIGLLVICPLLRIVAVWEGAPYGSYGYYFLTPFRADNLAIGALIAWYEAAGSITDQIRVHARRTLTILLCVFPIFAALIAKNTDAHMALWGHTYLAWLYGAVLFAVLQNRGADQLAPLRSRPAAFFAKISYALYLVHMVVAFCLSIGFGVSRDVSTISGLVLAASAFGLSVAICEVSYRWLEGPLIKFGHRRFRYGADSSRRALAPAE
jgi:peptidoglycan/LPS O-acetylase OafA/YrhL